MIINNAVIPTRPIFCLRFLLDVGCKIFAKRNLRSPLGRGIYGNKAIVVRKELINPDKEKSDICLRSPNGAKSKIAKHKDEETIASIKPESKCLRISLPEVNVGLPAQCAK